MPATRERVLAWNRGGGTSYVVAFDVERTPVIERPAPLLQATGGSATIRATTADIATWRPSPRLEPSRAMLSVVTSSAQQPWRFI